MVLSVRPWCESLLITKIKFYQFTYLTLSMEVSKRDLYALSIHSFKHYFHFINLFHLINSLHWNNLFHSKGQLVSTRLLGFFNSPKKRTKKLNFSTMVPQVEFFLFIFGTIEDTKKTFRSQFTFINLLHFINLFNFIKLHFLKFVPLRVEQLRGPNFTQFLVSSDLVWNSIGESSF